MTKSIRATLAAAMVLCIAAGSLAADAVNLYESQIHREAQRLRDADAVVRRRAAEALGYLRAWSAADALAGALHDESSLVRREAAMSLGWCGQRGHVKPLLDALDDADWTVRQAAWVALTNLTAMEWPYDALAGAAVRDSQARRWREWWAKAPPDRAPAEVMELLKADSDDAGNLALGRPVQASSTYKGPPGVMTSSAANGFWQTKNVAFPQHCTIDLGQPAPVARVVVRQYGPGYCMTEYGVSLSLDGRDFHEVFRGKEPSEPLLTVEFPRENARFVRITSYASESERYPTTFRQVEVWADAAKPVALAVKNGDWARERALRALGAMGGPGAAEAAAAALERAARLGAGNPSQRIIIQTALRTLGRLRDPAALNILLAWLDKLDFARYAAEALGDLGDARAVLPLAQAYARYARTATGAMPKEVPQDDRVGFESADRMLETPYAIAMALSRLSLDDPAARSAVAALAPQLIANIPLDFDGALLYEPESGRVLTACLLERSGMLDAAARAILTTLGRKIQPVAGDPPALAHIAAARVGPTVWASACLSTFCCDSRYLPDLIALLENDDGWVRINAAKALMFIGDARAIEPLAAALAKSRPEADYGYFGQFLFTKGSQGQDEYNDPSPRYREAFVRALGHLKAADHVPLLAKLMDDDANALEVRHAAAKALDEIGTAPAMEALKRAEHSHPFHTVRLTARESLWRHQVNVLPADHAPLAPAAPAVAPPAGLGEIQGVVFIKGDSIMPNRFQIDPWRQTYSTTDSGPTYRVGRNLYLLRPASPNGSVSPLTSFPDGYVADCEVSYDARRVLFCRRKEADPWWHVWEIDLADGKPRQLTFGPYHDVQPAYLPDGRIVFSSSRIGMRDEYHGYHATGLTVMNADGSDIHCVGFNLGRDNEPSVLPDGRIVFSRLDLFYSRLKTEITVQAAFPDGTHNVTLYGPERRDLWKQVTRDADEHWWGEAPPRHRVLRLTQPQPFDFDRILCASTGGLVLLGPARNREQFIPHDHDYAVTSPCPLPDGRILCAATKKQRIAAAGGKSTFSESNDLGLYLMDSRTGKLDLLYNDPQTADFEPRPLIARVPPPVVPENPESRGNSFTGRFLCASALTSQDPLVRERGRLVRVVEGMPVLGRHATHLSPHIPAWKNHVGTEARVLTTAPLAADGSFFVEVPADRLVHVQILDSDRRVVGNQLVWMYARPGETRSCVGCHQYPDSSPLAGHDRPLAGAAEPIQCLPVGDEFLYRAKMWNKGVLSDVGEERTRTVRAVNLIARQ